LAYWLDGLFEQSGTPFGVEGTVAGELKDLSEPQVPPR
jgi:hypothetical protein